MDTIQNQYSGGMFAGSAQGLALSGLTENRSNIVLQIDNQYDCSPKALASSFAYLLADFRYEEIMDMFGVGPFNFSKRKRIQREFRALCVALWRLALERSFSAQQAEAFQLFMAEDAARYKNRREYAAMSELILQYVDKLQEHGDSDFSEVSRHLLSLMEFDETRTKAMILKLALYVRRVYVFFFDNLV